MARAVARVSMPKQATKGDVIEIKTLIRHHMETGYRVDSRGKSIRRDIVTKIKVRYDGDEVFAMDLTQGVSANPYVAFTTVAVATGELEFVWEDNGGILTTVRKTLTVTE
ncbi:MAG: thiosulfate oxidation carrier complex protein SoxZ [Hyphomicrobiaceae bacterium]|nr:thiosulfate oxidation carrier complex protein SoxZ [Hyphomicrobiaceae bacterium]